MVVCRFFLGGNCRYGNNCWNEHPSGGNQGYQTTAQRQLFGGGRKTTGNNQYQWKATDSQQARPSTASTSSSNQLSPADIVRALSAEITSMWEAGKMWPFSCMGFEKDMPSLPGLTDISMEEMRSEAYDALKLGNIQPYIQKVESSLNEALAQRQELKNPGMSLKQTLISFIDDCRRKQMSSSGGQVSLFSDSSGGGLFGSGSEGSGLFGQNPATISQAPGPFGASSSSIGGGSSSFGGGSSPFGGGSSSNGGFGAAGSGGGQTLFGQAAAPPSGLFGATGSGLQSNLPPPAFGQTESPSLFGKPAQSSQPAFGQSAFGQTQNTASAGLFGKAAPETPQTPANTLFGKPVGSQFGSNAFATPQTATIQQNANPFGNANPGQCFGATQPLPAATGFGATSQPVSAIGGAAAATASATIPPTTGGQSVVDSLYTPIDQLTDEEKQQFCAQTFTVGMIPTKPPPKELCF